MLQFSWILAITLSLSNTLIAEEIADSDNWFQIDTVIFEYLQSETNESLDIKDQRSYPKNVIAIEEDFGTVLEDDGLKSRNQILSMENENSNRDQSIPFELENESARRFNREVIEALIKGSAEKESEDGFGEP